MEIYLSLRNVACNMRKGTFGYMCKLSTRISLHSPSRQTRDDNLRLHSVCAKVDLFIQKKYIKRFGLTRADCAG